MPDQIFAEYRAMTEAGKKEEAMAWLREKAENGDTEAMAFLGNGYYLGNFGKKDLEAAVYWYEKAAVRKDHVGKPANDALKRLRNMS